jgi:acetylornithine deacetylase
MNAPDTHHKLLSLDLIRTLIAFDTTSRESNLALIHWVRDYLADLGLSSRLTFDDEGRKANLFTTLGPAGDGGIVLSGHTDVVPVDGQKWDSNPFEAVERDGKLYGRGTSDMKSFIAVALAMTPEFLRRGPKQPLHLAFSYDEEVGCLGVRRLLADLKDNGIRPGACIIGEPTQMQPMIAHKGKHSYRCKVTGFACHSAYAPRGVNAVEAAAEVISYLKNMSRRIRDSGRHDGAFDVPYTTVHTGVVHGGTALNIVPKECVFDFEFRHLPLDDPEALFQEVKSYAERELLPEMRAVFPGAGFAWERMSVMPFMDTAPDSEVTRLGSDLACEHHLGKVSYGTEGALFSAAGIPAVICGPGSIEQAHKPNEFVELQQVALCEAFMARLADRVCGP